MKKLIATILMVITLAAILVLTSCEVGKAISAAGQIAGVVKPLIEKHEHVIGAMPDVESTCMGHGRTGGMMCLTCGEILVEPIEAPLGNHRYDGDSDATCNVCNYERFCLHRNTSKIVGKIATCQEKGLTDGEICLDCNATITLQYELPLAAHTESVISAIESTCYSHGKTEGKYCTVCKETLVAQEEAPLKAHTAATDEAKAPTCTSTGLTGGKHCSVCNEILLAQQIVPQVAHTYDDRYDETCNECGFVRDADCAHRETETLKGYAATCTSAGITDGTKCKKCGEILVAQTIIPITPHKEIIVPKVTPTCTQTGLTEGKKCGVCGVITLAQTVVALAPHTEATISGTPATCTSAGFTDGKRCTVCNKITVAQIAIPLIPHAWGSLIPEVAATLSATGIKEHYECTKCDAVSLNGSVICSQDDLTIPAITTTTTTKTGWVSKSSSSNPGLKYSAVIECQNRTATTVDVRITWTATIVKSGFDSYGQCFKFSSGSASSSNIKIVSYGEWKNSASSDRSKTASTGWITVPVSSASETSLNLSIYYWQINSNGLDMYKYDGTPGVKTTWTVDIPAYL